jgi:SAM-dependent methyltransferase
MDMRNELIGFEIDTVLAMNVLEHVEDDIESIKTISDTIRPGGKIILICPAQTLLYNALDRSFGHYRRYDKRKIISLASTIQAKIIELRYFNPYGIMGWVFNGSVLKRGTLPRYQTKIFNSVIPLLKRIDYIISWPAGLSVLAVLEKR